MEGLPTIHEGTRSKNGEASSRIPILALFSTPLSSSMHMKSTSILVLTALAASCASFHAVALGELTSRPEGELSHHHRRIGQRSGRCLAELPGAGLFSSNRHASPGRPGLR